MMDELTLEAVNAAIQRHLQSDHLKVAIVTGEAAALSRAIIDEVPSPIRYESPKPESILEEDRIIAEFPLGVAAENITVTSVEDIFERGT